MKHGSCLVCCLLVLAVACEDDPVGPMYGRIDLSGWVGDVAISGPAVVLDGAPTGLQLPAILSHLALGRHVVGLDVQGFESDPREAVVGLDHGETEKVQFQLIAPQNSGFLWVRSQPTGATVVVDELSTVELTPALLALTTGSHTVTVQKAGYTVEPSDPQSVLVPEGGVVEVSFTLTPGNGGATTRVVLAELFTATWCEYCPYSEEAIDRLADEYGAGLLAVVHYHPTIGGDPFGTTETRARGDWYECWAELPQIYFDGVVNLQHSFEATYNDYKAVVDSRLSVAANLKLDLDAAIDGDSLRVSVDITPVGQLSGDSVVCHVAVWEDNLDFSAPNGQTHFRYTVRGMLPPWDVTLVGPENRDWGMALDPLWKTADLGVVAFVQNMTTKEVLQAARHDF